MYQKPASPLSIGGVLDDGFKLLKAGYTRLLAVSLVSALVTLLPEFMSVSPEDLTTTGLWLMAISMPLQILLFAALVARTDAIANGEALSLGGSMGIGLRRLIPMFVCGILYVIAVMAGLVALIIPGIIIGLSLSFAMYLTVTDDMGPLEALKESHGLVWGNWWHTAAVAGVVIFIVMGSYFLLGFVSALLSGVASGEVESTGPVMLIGVTLLTTLLTPIMYAFYIALLNDLKLRKQGDDLDDRIGALEEA